MSMVEKKKHLFVITLDSGKKTYFDFVDHNIYGVSGKVVQNFNTEAKRILKSKEDDNFLAMYFYERTLTWPCRDTLKRWPISLVETVYSLYGNRYSVKVLSGIAEFCYKKNFKLDKKGVKIAVWFISAAFIWWGLEYFRMAFQSAAVWVHGSLCHADGSLSAHDDFLADYGKKGLTKPFLHVIIKI